MLTTIVTVRVVCRRAPRQHLDRFVAERLSVALRRPTQGGPVLRKPLEDDGLMMAQPRAVKALRRELVVPGYGAAVLGDLEVELGGSG